jgi:hypothetical protein
LNARHAGAPPRAPARPLPAAIAPAWPPRRGQRALAARRGARTPRHG